jgi:hypothetical protein
MGSGADEQARELLAKCKFQLCLVQQAEAKPRQANQTLHEAKQLLAALPNHLQQEVKQRLITQGPRREASELLEPNSEIGSKRLENPTSNTNAKH